MPGNKNIIIGGIVVVLLLVVYMANKGDSNNTLENLTNNVATTTPKTSAVKSTAPKSTVTTPTISKDGYYLISYGATGFSPKVLTVTRGKSVRFTNNSSNAMRIVGADVNNPASQAINQSKTVGRGGTYDYTFNEAGTFNYMNYNKTIDQGTIVVK